jgi:hypothetical protein
MNQTMPDFLRQIASSAGKSFNGNIQIINGAPLQFQWDNATTVTTYQPNSNLIFRDVKTAMQNRNISVDVLVLTERHDIPIQWHDTHGYVARWRDLARSANPSARVFLYPTWLGW